MSIEIAPELEQRLKTAAEKRGQPLSEYVTPALEALAAAPEPAEGAPSVLSFFEELWRETPAAEMAKLPSDLAEEHDHYIYGTPKRTPSQ
jgi:hypothetical protein